MSQNVLHLVEYLNHGGIERLLSEFARVLPENELHQTFFAYEMERYEGIAMDMKDTGHDVRIYKKKNGYDMQLLLKLLSLINKKRITVIHTHDFGPMEYAVPLKILRPHLKLIHTQHTVHNLISNKKYVLAFQAFSYFYEKVITVSRSAKSAISEACRKMKHPLIVINNGVDIKMFSKPGLLKAHRSAKNKRLKLINVSRISREKNLLYLLQACKELKNKGVDFTLHHAGAGNIRETKRIMNFVESNGLRDKVVFHGFENDIRNVLKEGDIFITCSKTEGHPVALLEAMASKKLCLCSDIDAHRDISPRGIKLFKLNGPDNLSNLLTDIQKHKDMYDEKIKYSFEDVCRKFPADHMFSRYLNYYNGEERSHA